MKKESQARITKRERGEMYHYLSYTLLEYSEVLLRLGFENDTLRDTLLSSMRSKLIRGVTMTFLNLLGVTTAYAMSVTTQQPVHPVSFLSILWLPLLLILVFYFLLIRPQTKRAKEHKQLLGSIAIEDEIITSGGIIGKVTLLKDSFVVLEIAKSIEIIVQKGSIVSVLPKGTIDSI